MKEILPAGCEVPSSFETIGLGTRLIFISVRIYANLGGKRGFDFLTGRFQLVHFKSAILFCEIIDEVGASALMGLPRFC